MCDYLTVLAHAGEHRAIAQCEHGALHVSWDIATVRLRPNDFMTLARFLDHCRTRTSVSTIADGWCQLSRDDRGAARLWMGQAGLALVAADVTGFVDLVDQAAAALRAAAEHPVAAPQSLWNCPIVMVNAASLDQN